MQSGEQALIMSSDQAMISLFLPFCLCPRACVHVCMHVYYQAWISVCVSLSVCLSILVPCGVSVGPEELCLIV